MSAATFSGSSSKPPAVAKPVFGTHYSLLNPNYCITCRLMQECACPGRGTASGTPSGAPIGAPGMSYGSAVSSPTKGAKGAKKPPAKPAATPASGSAKKGKPGDGMNADKGKKSKTPSRKKDSGMFPVQLLLQQG